MFPASVAGVYVLELVTRPLCLAEKLHLCFTVFRFEIESTPPFLNQRQVLDSVLCRNMPMRITVTPADPDPATCDVVGPALTTAQAGQVCCAPQSRVAPVRVHATPCLTTPVPGCVWGSTHPRSIRQWSRRHLN